MTERDRHAPIDIDVDADALLDCVEDAIIVVTDDLRFTYMNRVAREFLTTSAGVAPDAHPRDLDPLGAIHPDDLQHVLERLNDVVSGGPSHGSFRFRLREPEGAWRPVEAIWTDRRDSDRIGGVVVCFRNLTQEERLRSNLEAQIELDQHNRALRIELQERQRFLARLVRIQSSISRRAPLDDVLTAIIDGTTQLFGDVSIGLLLRDPADPTQLVLAASHGMSDEIRRQVASNSAGIGRTAFYEDRTVVIDDYLASETAVPGFVTQGVRTAMSAPIRSGGLTVGSLTIGSTWADTFTETEREMLEMLAEHAGTALLDVSSSESGRVALTDALTSLPSRNLFLERLGHAIIAARQLQRPLAVLFIDLDGFKAINDGRGHEAGDGVLKEIARRIETTIGARGTVARLRGDEFVVMLEACDASGAATIAGSVADAVKAPLLFGRHNLYVGATVGVAALDDSIRDADQLVRRADIAMYRGKREGGDQVLVFEPSMEHAVVANATLEGELRRSIRNQAIGAHFQPVVDLRTGSVVSVEALARWSSDTHGPVTPQRFIALAEQMHVVTELDLAVFRAACGPALELTDPASGLPVNLSVNLAPQHLEHRGVVEGLLSVAGELGFPATRLIVEITETEAMRDPSTVGLRIDELRRHGIRVAIDDFGTGYSSLAYLEQLPIDYVKIDRSFVFQIGDQARSRSLVEAMLRMVQSLGLTAVAEGVETPAQAHTLRTMGFELAQGFYFSRPVPATGLSDAMATIRTALDGLEPQPA